MARKKSKAKQQEELIKALLGLAGFGGFVGTYYLTNDWKTSATVSGFLIALVIVILIARQSKRIGQLKRSGISDIDKMDGIQFEHYLSCLFKSQGYSVTVTRSAGDYGADLVIAKDGKKIVVQAKRHCKDIGIKAVQEVHSSMNYYQASEAWVISNQSYTEAAIHLAKSNNVRLIDREQLIEMIVKMNPNAIPSSKQILQEVTSPTKTCQRCGQTMVLRKGPKGEFFGCSTYPKCRNIQRSEIR